MSLTGSNADVRIRAERADYGKILAHIYNVLAAKKGFAATDAPNLSPEVAGKLDDMMAGLLENEGRSVVVCGDNNPDYQVIVNGINQMLGNI